MGIFNLQADENTFDEQQQESVMRYKALFDSTNDAIMIAEAPTWKFTKGNPATLRMFNCDSDEQFESLAPWEVSPERQSDGQLSSVKAKEMIGKAIKEGVNFFDWVHKRHNGPEFQATVSLTRIRLGDKEFLQAIVRDVNKEKETEAKLKEKSKEAEDLREQIKKLEEKLASK